jgi:hypothetical protein
MPTRSANCTNLPMHCSGKGKRRSFLKRTRSGDGHICIFLSRDRCSWRTTYQKGGFDGDDVRRQDFLLRALQDLLVNGSARATSI